jgi:hypothetical protein
VLGKPVNDPVAEIVPPVYSCSYQTAEYDVVSVSVVEYSSPVEAEAGFQMAIDINDYEEVSDIGDRAYRGIVYDITVLTGKYELSVDINDSSEDEEAYQKAKGLAESALTACHNFR